MAQAPRPDGTEAVEERHWWYPARRRILLRLLETYLPSLAGRRVLYAGDDLAPMLAALASWAEAVGLATEAEAARRARQVRQPERDRGARIVEASLTGPVPLPKRTFDAVVIADTLGRAPDEELPACFRRCAELLRPGGIFIVSGPARPLSWTASAAVDGVRRGCRRGELRAQLERAGFRPLLLSYYNSFLAPAVLTVELCRRAAARPAKEDAETPSTGSGQARRHGDGGTPKPEPLPAPQAPRPAGRARNPFSASAETAINACMSSILAAESRLLPWIRFPYGLAVIAVARVGQTVEVPDRAAARFTVAPAGGRV